LSTILDSICLLSLFVWSSSIVIAISPPVITDWLSSSSSSSSDNVPFDGTENFLSSSSVIELFERRCILFKSSFD
jgi:hypothetical protein